MSPSIKVEACKVENSEVKKVYETEMNSLGNIKAKLEFQLKNLDKKLADRAAEQKVKITTVEENNICHFYPISIQSVRLDKTFRMTGQWSISSLALITNESGDIAHGWSNCRLSHRLVQSTIYILYF